MAGEGPHTPKFVTGANEKYFFMCGMLHESLRRHAPRTPLFVMDFGLNESQRRILDDKGMRLPLPAGLDPGMHPYKLKSSVDLYTRALPGPWVWIDSDMIAVRDCDAALDTAWQDFRRDGVRLAMTRDMGPDATLGAFSQHHETPKLRKRLAAEPGLDAAPYLNAGIVFFADDRLLPEWRTASESFEDDVCWEQNALNMLSHRAGPAARILDARAWNVHSTLLDEVRDEVSKGAGGLTCGGQPVNFLHVTSPNRGHVAEFEFPVKVEGRDTSGYARLFARPELMQRQTALLSLFLQSHPALATA